MKRHVYTGILLVALAAGVVALILHGFAPFSWVSYFTDMYPFFFGVSILAGLFLLVLRLPIQSLAGVVIYWMTVLGALAGCLVLCVLGLFVNPINWKNYSDYTSFDRVWSPISNIVIVIASIVLGVLMIRELRNIRRHTVSAAASPRSEPDNKDC
jgi:hypothetical protein